MTRQSLSRIAEVVFDHVAADRAVFRAFDAKGERLFEAARGAPTETAERLVGRAIEIGRPLIVGDLRQDPLFADLELDGNGRGPRAVLSYPWSMGGRPAGIAFFARTGGGRPFEPDHLEFLTLALAPLIYLLRRNGGSAPPAQVSAAGPGL